MRTWVWFLGLAVIAVGAVSAEPIGIFEDHVDIEWEGQLGAAGSATYDPATDTYVIEGSGADVWTNTGDNFHFAYTTVTGDFDIRADVYIEGGLETQDWIKAMLMARENLDGDAMYVSTRVRRDGQYSTQWRDAPGFDSGGSTPGDLRATGLNPGRHRFVRTGDVFGTYYLDEASGDWVLVDENEVDLADTLLVGLGVCAHDFGEIAVGTFSNIELIAEGAGEDLGIFEASTDIAESMDVLGAEGSASFDGNTYTVIGSGYDVWETNDAFHFLYKEWSGDFDIRATVSVTGGAEGQDWIKAMIMARQDLTPGSINITTRSRRDGQFSTQWRSEPDATSSSTPGDLRYTPPDGADGYPYRQRFVREGDVFSTYYLDEASGDWVLIDSNELVLEDPILLGFGSCGHDVGELATATFSDVVLMAGALGIFTDNVDIEWEGQLGAEGSAEYDPATDTYTVYGSGADVWTNTGDNFHFVYKEHTGDFDMRATVTVGGGLETQDWIKSMLMARESLDGDAMYVATRVRRDGQYSTQWRDAPGFDSGGSTPGDLRATGQNPGRHRFVREGDLFSTYYMDDAGAWVLVDENEVDLADTLLIGLGVCAHDFGEMAVGTFHDVEIYDQRSTPVTSWELH